MTLTNLFKTPFPWAGGKSDAAPLVWQALGDVAHYCEPFAGSLAVLLRRPHPCNRTYHSETVNDLEGLLVNAWRSMQMSPDATADAASWPVSEADLHARHLALLKWQNERQLEHLMGDPLFHDPVMAGWWMWGQSCWIGGGWCDGKGAWIVGDDGRIEKRGGTNAEGLGARRGMPHVSDNGQGVNRPQTREPGVSRQIPFMNADGQGVNRPQTREPGVWRKIPHISDNGVGVNHAGTREPGVAIEQEFHPMTMPELRRWMQFLSARLRHVRIINGDWKRAVTSGVLKMLEIRSGKGKAGIFLDPPYSAAAGRSSMYASEDFEVAHEVREWCVKNGGDPDYRIVLAGYEGEGHEELEKNGWISHEWFKTGFLKGGYKNQSKDGTQQQRERLWMSPHCIGVEQAQVCLFD